MIMLVIKTLLCADMALELIYVMRLERVRQHPSLLLLPPPPHYHISHISHTASVHHIELLDLNRIFIFYLIPLATAS